MTTAPMILPPMIQTDHARALPLELEDAMETAELSLTRHDRAYDVLRRTHETIPVMLAQRRDHETLLSVALSSGADSATPSEMAATTERELQDARHMRNGALEELLRGEGDLRAARSAAETEKEVFAFQELSQWRRRHSDALEALAQVRRDGEALCAALHLQVSVLGTATAATTATPPSDTALSAGTVRLGDVLQKLDASLSLVASIRADRGRDDVLTARLRNGLAAPATDGSFLVLKPIRCFGWSGSQGRPSTRVSSRADRFRDI
jgi:hypothetical protein